jgi:hypothetical protein
MAQTNIFRRGPFNVRDIGRVHAKGADDGKKTKKGKKGKKGKNNKDKGKKAMKGEQVTTAPVSIPTPSSRPVTSIPGPVSGPATSSPDGN